MKRVISLFLAAVLVFSLAACGEDELAVNNEEGFRIITSFYPVYVAALNLVDGAQNVTLINLTESDTGCLHDYKITTEDIKKMAGADLFIASGMDMEAFVGKTSFGIPRMEVLDCGEDIKHVIEDENEVVNPHYWMNIENAIEQCEKIKRTLCRLDPTNAAVYEANAVGYTEKLRALTEEAQVRCEKLRGKAFMVYHDSFDYFAEEFGLDITSVTDAEMTEEYAEYISQLGCMFVQESLVESREYRDIQKKTSCTTYVLDTLTTGELGISVKDAYINAIRHNLSQLEQALN